MFSSFSNPIIYFFLRISPYTSFPLLSSFGSNPRLCIPVSHARRQRKSASCYSFLFTRPIHQLRFQDLIHLIERDAARHTDSKSFIVYFFPHSITFICVRQSCRPLDPCHMCSTWTWPPQISAAAAAFHSLPFT